MEEMQRLAYSKKEVAQLLSLSVRSVDHFISTGALRAMKANRRVLISADSVKNFIKKGIMTYRTANQEGGLHA